MNLGEIIDNFNLLCSTFFSELYKVTNSGEVSKLQLRANMVKQFDKKIMINIFIDKFYKYRASVMSKSIKDFDRIATTIKDDDYSGEIDVLFVVWEQLSENNKKVMFEYLYQMILCCDLFMSTVVGSNKLNYSVTLKKQDEKGSSVDNTKSR